MANATLVTTQVLCYRFFLGPAKFEPSSLMDALNFFLVLDLFRPYTSEFQKAGYHKLADSKGSEKVFTNCTRDISELLSRYMSVRL